MACLGQIMKRLLIIIVVIAGIVLSGLGSLVKFAPNDIDAQLPAPYWTLDDLAYIA